MFEAGTETLDVIARRSGFGCAETMRRAFHRDLGVTPNAYRSTRGDRSCPLTTSGSPSWSGRRRTARSEPGPDLTVPYNSSMSIAHRGSIAGLVTIDILLMACAGGHGGRSVPNATPGAVRGTIMAVGGPPNATPQREPGTVVARRGGHIVAKQDVAEGAEFRFSLAPGRYQLTVVGTGAACQKVDVDVAASSTRTVTLTCQRK
jgi:hypothetical protein